MTRVRKLSPDLNEMNATKIGKCTPGISLFVAFFWFGVLMCSLTIFLLLFPGTPLDVIWRLKPAAHDELAILGPLTIAVMVVVGTACAAAAIGLAIRADWGRRTAIGVLMINLIGDFANAIIRADWHTLVGLPIGGLMILYLMSSGVRKCFKNSRMPVALHRLD